MKRNSPYYRILMSKEVKQGDVVRVHYTGKLENGTIFDSSKEREPIKFKIGDKSIIPGFEQAVLGMKEGEKKTVTIAPEKAYGPHMKELVSDVEKTNFPAHITPELGLQLELKQPEGPAIVVTITSISGDNVTLDANHPLAGKNLIFDIELLEISA